ncbi:helix-turn-helix transcriptional regulator [Mobilitalea sibirica]|uniref:Helix-turn-helix transcriptional regulator n=1 Tax=Mobilitalea sibirica TaxID=1462919 RepID=A0A8J7GXZ4_9FIRM|nr:AraC family transcriptional regulator [Mobilitalea sibirica]MBH1940224.1 helix-turn-helix transcriptional regulator [Mobilitalea sibirica]
MLVGTKGLKYYQDYITPVNYYENENVLYNTEISDCYRLVYIVEGQGSLLINNKRITIVPLTILCLNENDVIKNIDFIGDKMVILCFLPSAINNKLTIENIRFNEGLSVSDSQDRLFLSPFILHDEKYIEYKYIDLETASRLNSILECLKEQIFIQSDAWPCLTRSYLIELLFVIECFYRIKKDNVKQLNTTFSIEDVRHYLHNNFRKKITLDDLAKRFHTNRTTLAKKFKEATGQTIVNYLHKTRIHIAAGMLRDTYLTVDAIIERVGFSNVTHFNKVFKEYNQCLPKEYRNKFKPYSS